MSTIIINKIFEVRDLVKKLRKEDKKIALVPTMGCLHAGHQSLIEKAHSLADVTIVSVFVNPIQFCPGEDYDKYPRTLVADKLAAEKAGADYIFAPSVNEMYPDFDKMEKFTDLTMVVPPYELTDIMCGKSRIGHFDGVETVVTKLFNIVLPDIACFGMKDIQQLFLIKKMVRDLNIPVEIVSCPLVREENGLALSSRNKYLSEDDKKIALSLSKALFAIKDLYKAGVSDTKKFLDCAITVLDKKVDLEYIEFVSCDTFKPVETVQSDTICAMAARVGGVRLIDNIVLEV